LLTLLILAIPARAQVPPATGLVKPRLDPAGLLPLLSGGTTDAVAGAIRGYLVRAMPDPLYEAWPGWGNTCNVARGIKWHHAKPSLQYKPKNDGKWTHVRVSCVNPADTVIFDIRDVQAPEQGRLVFTVFLSFDAKVEYDQQNWESGVRLYAGSSRAKFRVRALVHCEATYRLEPGKALLPDAVFRLRVTQAQVGYDNFVMEKVAGIAGEAGKVLGDAIRGGLKRWDPSLERNLLAKANAAIEQAGDTKEVRVSLYELIKKKGWAK